MTDRRSRRMAGSQEFRQGMEQGGKDPVTSAAVNAMNEQQPNTYEARGMSAPDNDDSKTEPEKKAEDLKNKYVRSVAIKERESKDIKRAVPEGLDPDLVKETMQGSDWGNGDMKRYTAAFDKKYGTSGVDSDSDSEDAGSGNRFDGGEGSGGKRGNRYGGGRWREMASRGPQTFADKAIRAAERTNPVDFKALDQRIHDRPLYMQAQADLKHGELFGDTWSWDSAPEWNIERFKAKEQENRYEDVMKNNKYDD